MSDRPDSAAGLHEAVARLERDLRAERDLREALDDALEATRHITAATSGDEAFRLAVEVLRELLTCEELALLETDGTRGLVPTFSTHPALTAARWVHDGVLAQALSGEKVGVVATAEDPAWADQDEEVRALARSALLAPLTLIDKTAVLLCTHSNEGHFGASHVELLRRLAPLASQAWITKRAEAAIGAAAELAEEKHSVEAAITLLEHAMAAIGGGLGHLDLGTGRIEADALLKRMLGSWRSVDEWWSGIAETMDAPRARECRDCGSPTLRGTRTVSVDGPAGPARFRMTFAGHHHRGDAPAGEVVLVEDQTHLRPSDGEGEALRLLPRENPAPVIRVSESGRVLSANPAGRMVLDAGELAPDGELRGSLAEVARGVADVGTHDVVSVDAADRHWTFTLMPAPVVGEVHLFGRDVTEERRSSRARARMTSRLSALISNIRAGILVEDENRRVVLANPGFCEMFGIPGGPDDLVGADCALMADQAKHAFVDPDGFSRRIEEILGRSETVEGDQLRTRDGRILVRDFVPVKVEGESRGHLWHYRDVTESRAEAAMNRAIVDTAMDAIVSIDHEGRLLEFNPAAEAMFGHRRGDVLGKLMGDIIVPPAQRANHAEGMARYLATGEGRILGKRLRLSALRADGEEFPVELIVRRIPGSEPPSFTGYIRDLTLEQRREEELNAAKVAAEEANRAKSQFLAVMSHEIRTPMNAILGMTELILDAVTSPDQRGLLKSVQSNAESLLDVINDVLDFSKVEAGHLTLRCEPFSIGDVVESVAEIMAGRAFEKGLELSVDLDPEISSPVDGDPNRLRQILVNLMGNAVKFTQQGEVSLTVRVAGRDEDRTTVRFSVRDTGIGIEPESLERVFLPFHQSDSSLSRQFGGTGLGLGISRSLVELMAGRIWAQSELGQGSTFDFEVAFVPSVQGFPRRRASDFTYERWQAWVLTPTPGVADGIISACGSLNIPATPLSVDSLAEALADVPPGVHSLVVVDQKLGLDVLRQSARVAREAADRSEVQLCVLVPPGPVRAWEVEGPERTAYVSKPAGRRKIASVVAQSRAPGVVENPPAESEKALPLNGRILLVEDNEANREYATRVLEGVGYHVTLATTGGEGLRAALSSSFDLVVTDLDMPEMDGFEMAEKILSELGSKAPPVLAFTAHAVQGFKERCLEAGMVGYVAKPVRPAELLSAVRQSLRPAGTVLVVDDSGDNRMLVDRHLSKEGYKVEKATGGREAIERIRAGGVDLVLLDMNMPELDGYETARRIRALPGRGDVPVLAMTSWVGAEERERCLEAGCTAYLEKPIRRARLLELTRELLAAEPPPVGTEPAEEAVQVDPAIADLVPEFLEGRRQDAARLRELLRAADLDAIRILAHNLAGSGAPYGFPRLTELGRTLESVALEGEPDDVSRWLDELDAYLDSVKWEVGSDE